MWFQTYNTWHNDKIELELPNGLIKEFRKNKWTYNFWLSAIVLF